MCLTLRALPPVVDISKLPYNNTKIRWKSASLVRDEGERDFFSKKEGCYVVNYVRKAFIVGLHRRDLYKNKAWMDANLNGIPDQEGFHVLLSYADAEKVHGDLTLKLEVDGFLRSGTWCSGLGELKCETWKRMRILEVYYAGRKVKIEDLTKIHIKLNGTFEYQ